MLRWPLVGASTRKGDHVVVFALWVAGLTQATYYRLVGNHPVRFPGPDTALFYTAFWVSFYSLVLWLLLRVSRPRYHWMRVALCAAIAWFFLVSNVFGRPTSVPVPRNHPNSPYLVDTYYWAVVAVTFLGYGLVSLVGRLRRGNPLGNAEARTSCQSGAPRPMLEINVVADSSGKPIPGASVLLGAPPGSVTVDSAGHVLVDTLPSGTYALWIRAPGFQAQGVVGVRLEADSHCKVAIRMAREWDERL